MQIDRDRASEREKETDQHLLFIANGSEFSICFIIGDAGKKQNRLRHSVMKGRIEGKV